MEFANDMKALLLKRVKAITGREDIRVIYFDDNDQFLITCLKSDGTAFRFIIDDALKRLRDGNATIKQYASDFLKVHDRIFIFMKRS